jgi:hypothetical protein
MSVGVDNYSEVRINITKEEIMKKITLLLILATISVYAGWTRTYGGPLDDEGYRVFQTSDGGYIIAGTTNSFGAGESDIWLLKTDSQGDTLWTKTYGGNDDEGIVCLNQTLDGGYILAARTSSFDTYGKSDIWVLRTDSLGDTLWTLVCGTDASDYPAYVGERLEGGYVVIGGALGSGSDIKVLFISLNSQGELEYVKEYLGWVQCANKFSDSLYLVVDYADVLQLSSQGDSLWGLWQATAWMTNWIEKDNSASDTFLFTGCEYQNELDVPDLFVGSGDLFDGSGWGIYYGGPSTMEIGLCIRSTTDGGFIVVGEKEKEGSGYDLWLIKHGSTSWAREFGGFNDDAGFCVDTTSDGGYIITGITRSYGAGGKDLWLIKTDSLGLVSIEEDPTIDPVGDFQTVTVIGPQIVLSYKNYPQGFHAEVFDASGRKVDEIKAAGSSGTITWGMGHSPGVYFFRVERDTSEFVQRVVLVR